jgi:Flp pilus assembly protein TadG
MKLIRNETVRSCREHGQTLVSFALFLLALILFMGLVIDIGMAYVMRASLSKAVDAACLTGARNLALGQTRARQLARAAFAANYPQAVPDVTFGLDATGNILINVSATTSMNTFFIGVLPDWKQLRVSSAGQAVRVKLDMHLVLDRSGSMLPPSQSGNNGCAALPQAVSDFIDLFSEDTDRVGVASFASHAKVDVPLKQSFKDDAKNAVQNWCGKCGGQTFADGGMTLAYTALQNEPGGAANAARVVVFFTDGYANTFLDSFGCAGQAPVLMTLATNHEKPGDGNTFGYYNDPATGTVYAYCLDLDNRATCGLASYSCIPTNTTFASIAGGDRDISVFNVWNEGRLRALDTARRLRTDPERPTTIYSIGLGNTIDRDFLKEIANDPGSPNYNPNQPQGMAVFAPTAADLQSVFQTIASQILLRLTR